MTEIYLETTRKFYRKYSNYLYNRYFYFCLIVSLIGVLCLLTLKLKNGNGKGGEKKDFTLPPYVVGLGYYELGGETVTVIVPSSIPENTALIITLYAAYRKGYHGHHGYIRIKGSGQSHITTLIWATYDGTLHFINSNVKTKRLNYVGFKEKSVNQVAMKEFGKNTDVILSSYRSPLEINIPFKRPTKKPSYIVGLAYYEFRGRTVTVDIPSSIPENTALIITSYEAYQAGFGQRSDATIYIAGAGRSHVTTIIWSTYENSLNFNANAVTKRLNYVGYRKTSVNKVAQKEFGKDADIILYGYGSPLTIRIPPVKLTPSYIIGLAYYELGGNTVTIIVQSSIPQNTALIITMHEVYHRGFRQQEDANINIEGAGRNHISTIIWSTLKSTLHFNTNSTTKRLKYVGLGQASVNLVAYKEFGKDADIILTSFKSPLTINLH